MMPRFIVLPRWACRAAAFALPAGLCCVLLYPQSSEAKFRNVLAVTTPTPSPSPTPTPPADMAIESLVATPNPVATTQFVTFAMTGRNLGPAPADFWKLSITLPSGVSFITCVPGCSAPAGSDGGTAEVTFDTLPVNVQFTFSVLAKVNAAPGATLNATANVSSGNPDPNLANNGRAVSVRVVELTAAGPLQLLIDQTGPALDQAAAFELMTLVRDPFPVVSPNNLLNLGTDKNTRVIVFISNLLSVPGEPASAVVVNLVGSNSQNYDVSAEDVRAVANSEFIQVSFRLPDTLASGTCTIRIKAHAQVSNAGTIRIKP